MTHHEAEEYNHLLINEVIKEAETLGIEGKAGGEFIDRNILVIPDDPRKGMIFLGEESASYKLGNVRLNIKSAIILSFENNLEKSFTVNKFTVLSAIVISSSSVFSVPTDSSNDVFIFWPSPVFTSFTKYVLVNPINTAIIEVITKTPIIDIMIFPNLFGCFIFEIAVVIFKKISGIIITNNRFKKISPNGLRIVAFSWNIIPTIAPTIIATKRIIVDL